MKEPTKPPFLPIMNMDHVPAPDPANFWELTLNEPRVIMAQPTAQGFEPIVTITVRKIDGERVSLQITKAPSVRSFGE